MNIAIITSQFNKEISDRLVKGAIQGLRDAGLHEKDWALYEVPGAFEIPYQIQKIIDAKKFDGAIALGCVIKGDTDHYQAVCDGVTYGIQKVSIENRFPVMFGVLMCTKEAHALDRSNNNKENKGYECAQSLVKMLTNA